VAGGISHVLSGLRVPGSARAGAVDSGLRVPGSARAGAVDSGREQGRGRAASSVRGALAPTAGKVEIDLRSSAKSRTLRCVGGDLNRNSPTS